MASSTATKQQHYRKLMKEQKAKMNSSAEKTKIDHPLAKYNSLDQLLCVVCGQQIKSDILWISHLRSRKHLDTVTSLKARRNASSPLPPPPPSSSSSTHTSMNISQREEGQQRSFTSCPSSLAVTTRKREFPGDAGNQNQDACASLPKKKSKKSKTQAVSSMPVPSVSGVPADFFDAGVKKKFYPKGEEPMYESSDEEDAPPILEITPTMDATPTKAGDRVSSNLTSDTLAAEGDCNSDPTGSLPKGFFDDPKQDAKARQVEYKDPMAEEWEKFQKSIQKEDDMSEALLFEGDEETMEDREMEEVKEQVNCFNKAEQLRLKHELLSKRIKSGGASSKHKMEEMDSQSSDDEADFDELLSWRAKIS